MTDGTNIFTYDPELVMLGIIHTHPTWTSFLSSVNLHALWDYAQYNPSLISIVVSPKHNTSPAFCLTSLGLKDVGKCKEEGFHKHNTDDTVYYKQADHLIDDPSIIIEIVDYRITR